jgi:hypothetical protein
MYTISCDRRFFGKYEVQGSFSDRYKNFLLIKKDKTYRLLFPSIEPYHDGFYEIDGKWEKKKGQLLLTSFVQPKFYDLLKVEENLCRSRDSVYFEFFVINKYIDTVYKTPPSLTAGGLRLSDLDTTFNLFKNPSFACKWNDYKNRFLLLSDVKGFLSPYYIKDRRSNCFKILYSENDFLKLQKREFDLEEPLDIKNDTLIYRDYYKFIKVEDVPKGL